MLEKLRGYLFEVKFVVASDWERDPLRPRSSDTSPKQGRS